MHDLVVDAAQRQHGAMLERRRLRQPAKARGDPATVTLRKLLGIDDGAARRHGQNRFAVTRMNAQGVAPRASMPSQSHRENLRAMLDENRMRFGGTPIEKCANGHV